MLVPAKHHRRAYRERTCQGFTLMEVVLVIVIVGLLAGILAPLISRPTEAYIAAVQRGDFVQRAQQALERISREIRLAVPNSVRIDGSGQVVEFLRSVDGGRYRAQDNDPLDFTAPDTSFDVIGHLNDCLSYTIIPPPSLDCVNRDAYCLVVGNMGAGSGADAFNLDNLATIQSCAVTAADGSDHIVFDNTTLAGGTFPQPSPNHRFQVVDTPVAYLCDLGAGTIRRYDHYEIHASQADVDTHAELIGLATNPAEHALLADGVTACQFSYDAGVTDLMTVSITVGNGVEDVTLNSQIRVANQP